MNNKNASCANIDEEMAFRAYVVGWAFHVSLLDFINMPASFQLEIYARALKLWKKYYPANVFVQVMAQIFRK